MCYCCTCTQCNLCTCVHLQCSKCIICESHIYAFMIGIETITNSNPHCSISQYTWDCMMRQFYLYLTILIIRNPVTLNLFFLSLMHVCCVVLPLHDYTISTLQSHAHVLHASDLHTTVHYCTHTIYVLLYIHTHVHIHVYTITHSFIKIVLINIHALACECFSILMSTLLTSSKVKVDTGVPCV